MSTSSPPPLTLSAGRPLRRALAGLAALTFVACGDAAPTGPVPPADQTTNHGVFSDTRLALVATGTRGHAVRLEIGNPTLAPISGSGSVTIVDLNEERALERHELSFTAAPGGTVVDVDAPSLADIAGPALVGYRVDYALSWDGGGRATGSRSAWVALERVGLVVMAPKAIPAGGEGQLTLFAVDPTDRSPLAGATVRMTTATGETETTTDAAGRATLPLAASGDGATEAVTLHVASGAAVVAEPVEIPVTRAVKLLLTTDKPLYQPGQTVHLRALALGAVDRRPAAGADVMLEILDPKGNRIARETLTTSAHGIAATTFTLARQVNLGEWTLQATLGGTVTGKTVTVDRYVLPKFKVSASLDEPWYSPGQRVVVSGSARYFFGRDVAGGTVKATASTFDVELVPFAEVETTTAADGTFSLAFNLPATMVGLPLTGGSAPFEVALEIADAAGQTVTQTLNGRASNEALSVSVIPDGGRLVAGLENTLHLITTDPIGRPVEADVVLRHEGLELARVTTNAEGFATAPYTPADDTVGEVIDVTATAGGKSATRRIELGARALTSDVMLTTDRTLYRVGDTALLTVRVTAPAERVWVDGVRGGATLFSRAVDIRDGEGRLELDLDGTMAGDVMLAAYYVDRAGGLLRDQRVVWVEGDGGLNVALTPRAATYRPGELAEVDIAVTDAEGEGVAAAVGVQIVDEALFAVMDGQPGLLRVFFEIVQDLMTPTLSPGCGGCDVRSVVASGGEDLEGREDTARIAFSALGEVAPSTTARDTAAIDETAALSGAQVFATRERQRTLEAAIARVQGGESTDAVLRAIVASVNGRQDPWGRRWEVTADSAAQTVRATSPGPDEARGNADDLSFTLHRWDLEQLMWEGDLDNDFGWGRADDAAGGPPTEDPSPVPEDGEGDGAVRVRRNFPETLFVNPAIITDDNGEATFSVPLADSITSWRMTGLASTLDGRTGSGVGEMVVFQDFFVDIDAPVALTRNDRVQVGVALYNYLDSPQTVTVTLTDGSWFESFGGTENVVTLDAGEVRGVSFEIAAREVGQGALRVTARGSAMSDAVERVIRVVPDGRAFDVVEAGRFPGGSAEAPGAATVTATVTVPEGAIAGANELLVEVFPGVMAQVTEGMESMLRMPTGCFEQTTSSAWPNVLVTDYMVTTGTSNPEIEAKARTYIHEGYQRLLTFECASGGFNWWEGDDPGNTVLTAVGVMMFTDTKKVAFVDEAVIDRAAAYLVSTQRADGSWGEERHLHAGNEGLGAGSLRATAYVTWALTHGGKAQGAVQKALSFLRQNLGAADAQDPYTASLMLLAFATNDRADAAIQPLASRIVAARTVDGDDVFWEPAAGTVVGGYGDSGAIETTAVATLALLEAGVESAVAQQAVSWLVAQKDPNGNWGYSTQATVLTLKALLAALGGDASGTAATVTVRMGGVVVATRTFTPQNADIRWQLDLGEGLGAGEHEVELEYEGRGNLSWQVRGTHYIPHTDLPPEPASPLSIEVAYDRTQVATDDVVAVNVRVANDDAERTGMMMAELGIPPGFALDLSALEARLGDGAISNLETTALKLVVYLEPITPEAPVTFTYHLRALYPLEATAPESTTWFYYDQATQAKAPAVMLSVD